MHWSFEPSPLARSQSPMVAYTHRTLVKVWRQNGALPVCAAATCGTAANAMITTEATSTFTTRTHSLLFPAQLMRQAIVPPAFPFHSVAWLPNDCSIKNHKTVGE
jgi:hypothetical protein